MSVRDFMTHQNQPLRIGHRGVSGSHFENSLEAFRAAVAVGLDGVELDIHATADGEFVVHHDPAVPGHGDIRALPLKALRTVRLPNGEPLPTLEEALAVLGDLRVYVEVKDLDPRFDGKLVETLQAYRADERLAVHSFDHRIVARLRRLAPWLPGGILSVSYPIDPAAELIAAGAVAYWMVSTMIDAELAAAIHRAGGSVIGWTVNDRAVARRLAALGVDGLCGNYPERLLVE
jgi:glycerophosphoryl diester phosphodiesterase